MLRVYVFAMVVAILTVMGRPIDGQNADAGVQRSPFRSSVDVVALNVTVTDASRRYVTDLDGQDFQVFEDGRRQDLAFFRKDNLQMALALLIDTSASMEQSLPVAQEAAVGFVRALGPGDLASLVEFNSRVQVRQDFTSDRTALESAIRRTAAGGSTSLYNAVYIALKELNKTRRDEPIAESRRRAILILSDGEDTSSVLGFDEVLDLASRFDTAIYAIGLLGHATQDMRRPTSEAPFVLRRFAEQTGGRAFFPLDVKELAGIYGEIKTELSSQYFLAYESNDTRRDGQFRHVAVRVERAGAVARARPGYYAPSR
jgi:Ca-activated chloride channel family protein